MRQFDDAVAIVIVVGFVQEYLAGYTEMEGTHGKEQNISITN